VRALVIALDHDGTISVDGSLDARVRAGLERARARGLAAVLVTGRILADLQRLVGSLEMFEAVVAENGCVLHFPRNGRTLLLARPPAGEFLSELRQREIPFLAGQCVVELDAAWGAAVLEVVRDTQQPLVLAFNRGRLMVLPQAVSKATGLREALRALRLSPHGAVGVGDAENDHELLGACELGVAVAWGSPVLVTAADEVLPGAGPPDVADFIDQLSDEPRITAERLTRRATHLGVRAGGEPFELALRGRNLLIAGDTRSGKSWVAGVLCEQLVLEHYCVCVIDPEGEYAALEALPAVVVFDADPPPQLDDLERTLRYPDLSAVLDLSRMPQESRGDYVRSVLESLRDLRRRTGIPHRVVIDEAHYFLADDGAHRLMDLSDGGYTLVTWRPSKLERQVLKGMDTVVVTSVTDAAEAAVLVPAGEGSPQTWTELDDPDRRYALAWRPGEPGAEPIRFKVSARLTPHVRHSRKYLERRVPTGKEFWITPRGSAEPQALSSLEELVEAIAHRPVLDAHLDRGDLSRWIAEVIDDAVLARQIERLEERARRGRLARPHTALLNAVRERYGAAPASVEPRGARGS
jgi:hydroxymethylpyrimidine pyrophosphatase-like HAD family hydrolase